MKSLLSNPCLYYYARQCAVFGLPFRKWVALYHLNRDDERIADVGCGPADMLRFVDINSKPSYYLGIDISEKYIENANAKASLLGIPADFIVMDLESITFSDSIQGRLKALLEEKGITTVLLLGVLHHINDVASTTLLNTIFEVRNVQTIITQDVLIMPRNIVNNFFASRDRGRFVRTESAYDRLLELTKWKGIEKHWTNPGISSIKYIHYKLRRSY
jgi:SAM-dependent methyltransferase